MSSPGGKQKCDRIRIAVLGATNCGKTALIVRYLTKRFIGEYQRNKEYTYRQRMDVNGDIVNFEVLDTIIEAENEELSINTSYLRWADGIILMYDITNRRSFSLIPTLQEAIAQSRSKNQTTPSIILVGNKSDLAPKCRHVRYKEAENLALTAGIPFYEISVREHYEDVQECFNSLISRFRTIVTKKNIPNKKGSVWPSFKSLRKRSVSYPR